MICGVRTERRIPQLPIQETMEIGQVGMITSLNGYQT